MADPRFAPVVLHQHPAVVTAEDLVAVDIQGQRRVGPDQAVAIGNLGRKSILADGGRAGQSLF